MIQDVSNHAACLCAADGADGRTLGPVVQACDRDSAFDAEAVVHIGLLRNAAVHLTGNMADAEDLLQETLLRAYRAFDTYRRGTNCKAWLFRILKNSFCNGYRKRIRRPSHVSLDKVEDVLRSRERPPIPIPHNLSIQPALIELMDDDIRNAIDKVDSIFRTTLVLCDVHGLTYREAAEVMMCPVGTVRSRLYRARHAMRKHLKNTEIAKRMERHVEAAAGKANGTRARRVGWPMPHARLEAPRGSFAALRSAQPSAR